MKIDLRSTCKWIEKFDKADNEGKAFEYLAETLKNDISEYFFNKVQLYDCVYDTMYQLQREKQFDKILELYKYSEKYMERFKKPYYLDFYCIDYYLFNGDIQGIRKHLDNFLKEPVKSIDVFIPFYDKIVYFGYRDLSLEICRELIDKVKDAPGLLPGAERDYNKTVYAEKIQKVYCDIKNSVPINKREIIEYLEKYDYYFEEIDIDTMQSLWGIDDPGLPSYEDYVEDGSLFEWKLMLLFMEYMDEKDITFATAYDIWQLAIKCFKANILGKRKCKSFENLFKIDKEKHTNEIYWRMDPIFSNKVTCAYAAAWGLQYLADFLFKYGYISEKTYDKNTYMIDSQKIDIIKRNPNVLWQYKFLYNWGKPDGTSEEQFEIIRDLFDNSFEAHIEFIEADDFPEDFEDEE